LSFVSFEENEVLLEGRRRRIRRRKK